MYFNLQVLGKTSHILTQYDPEDPTMADEPIALIFMSEHARWAAYSQK